MERVAPVGIRPVGTEPQKKTVWYGVGKVLESQSPRAWENRIMRIVEEKIVPRLSEKNQQWFDAHYDGIRTAAQGVGVGITTAEVVAAAVVAEKGIRVVTEIVTKQKLDHDLKKMYGKYAPTSYVDVTIPPLRKEHHGVFDIDPGNLTVMGVYDAAQKQRTPGLYDGFLSIYQQEATKNGWIPTTKQERALQKLLAEAAFTKWRDHAFGDFYPDKQSVPASWLWPGLGIIPDDMRTIVKSVSWPNKYWNRFEPSLVDVEAFRTEAPAFVSRQIRKDRTRVRKEKGRMRISEKRGQVSKPERWSTDEQLRKVLAALRDGARTDPEIRSLIESVSQTGLGEMEENVFFSTDEGRSLIQRGMERLSPHSFARMGITSPANREIADTLRRKGLDTRKILVDELLESLAVNHPGGLAMLERELKNVPVVPLKVPSVQHHSIVDEFSTTFAQRLSYMKMKRMGHVMDKSMMKRGVAQELKKRQAMQMAYGNLIQSPKQDITRGQQRWVEKVQKEELRLRKKKQLQRRKSDSFFRRVREDVEAMQAEAQKVKLDAIQKAADETHGVISQATQRVEEVRQRAQDAARLTQLKKDAQPPSDLAPLLTALDRAVLQGDAGITALYQQLATIPDDTVIGQTERARVAEELFRRVIARDPSVGKQVGIQTRNAEGLTKLPTLAHKWIREIAQGPKDFVVPASPVEELTQRVMKKEKKRKKGRSDLPVDALDIGDEASGFHVRGGGKGKGGRGKQDDWD